MFQQSADISAILSRLERVERQNRRMKQIALGIGVLVCSILLTAQARPNRTIEAERFIVKDASGKVRAAFGMEPNDSTGATLSIGSPGITAAGPEEKYVVYLHGGNDLAWLILREAGHKQAINARVGRPDDPSLPAPQLSLIDRDAYELDLGKTGLVTTNTGESHQTSAVSVVMIGKNKDVLWSAP